MGQQQSKPPEPAEMTTINENVNQQNMQLEHTIKIDLFFVICFALIIFIFYKLNQYFKNYVNKKAVVNV